MSEAQVTSESPVVASDRRALVLRVLRGTRAPMGIAELTEEIGLHPNTIRFHLDGLDNDGLVERSIESTTTPGRPRVLYQATTEGVRAGPRDYAGLAGVLASALTATAGDPADAARAAGRDWGRTLAGPMPARPSGTSACRRLVEILDSMGFEPAAHPARRPTQLRIYNCPFRDVARVHQDVVCALHMGLMQGMLVGADGVHVASLQPDLESGVCTAQLAR
ncbi:helix-turn-helix transcriptional regulator [Nostocoides vanveenii]|uniref:Helix-turn-helix domain-containing protein n=1 Tax=Nostocoides vanveenii TaxID=330835 RepID=A0ABP4WF14_9MICO